MDAEAFANDLTDLLNRHGADTLTNTPDYLLAGHLVGCLNGYMAIKRANDEWHGISSAAGPEEIAGPVDPATTTTYWFPIIDQSMPRGTDPRISRSVATAVSMEIEAMEKARKRYTEMRSAR